MFRSNFCDYSDAYIVMKEAIAIFQLLQMKAMKHEKLLGLKTNAPFRLCISQINSTLTGNSKHIDIIMPIGNLLEYS